MKNIIQFVITKGEKQFVAEGVGIPVVTQAETLDELMKNVSEATELFLEDEDISNYNIRPKPSVLVSFELPQYA